MKPAPFEYHAPGTAAEAVELLAELGEGAKALAGGQSLIPMLALRLAVFDHLVDVGRIRELQGIERRNGSLWIGAGWGGLNRLQGTTILRYDEGMFGRGLIEQQVRDLQVGTIGGQRAVIVSFGGTGNRAAAIGIYTGP